MIRRNVWMALIVILALCAATAAPVAAADSDATKPARALSPRCDIRALPSGRRTRSGWTWC